MNKTQLFSVALKIFGLILLIRGIQTAVQLVVLMTAAPDKIYSTYQISPIGNISLILLIVFYVGLGYLFVSHPDKISEKLIPGKSDGLITKETLLEIVLSFIGLDLIIGNIPVLLRQISRLFMFQNDYSFLTSQPIIYIIQFILFIAEIIIGIFLLRYAQRLAKFLVSKIPSKFWAK